MERPEIICHMVTSLDGKVTGDFLFDPRCASATESYYRLHRESSADGFICGRVTMEGSFTSGWYPDLEGYAPVDQPYGASDFIPEDMGGFYAVAFDTHGKLGWRSSRIVDPDGDPGYDGARIIEVLSEAVDGRYLGYLEELGIPYIFAGKDEIDVRLALHKLKTRFGCQRLLLEGGSILNGAFLLADAVDRLSLVVAPLVAEKDDKPLFFESRVTGFSLTSVEREKGNLLLLLEKDG